MSANEPPNAPDERSGRLPDTALAAIRIVEANETNLPPDTPQNAFPPQKHASNHIKHWLNHIDWNTFLRVFSVWVFSAILLSCVILGLTALDNPDHLFTTAVSKTDTASLFFSLVLATTLEQVWTTKSTKSGIRLALLANMLLSFLGLFIYSIFTVMLKFPTDPVNRYLGRQFEVNLAYIISSTLFVIINLLLSSWTDKERKK